MDFTERTISVLAKLGWIPERREPVDDDIARLSASGWKIFPTARQFLESFQGLPRFEYPTIPKGRNSFEFHCLDGEDIRPKLDNWMLSEDKNLYPIGSWSWMYLLIDEGGVIYITDGDNKIYSVGTNLTTSLDNLIFESNYVLLAPLC